MNKTDNYVAGIDIGSEKITIVLSNTQIEVLDKIRIAKSSLLKKDVADKCIELTNEIVKRHGIAYDRIRAIGVSVSNKEYSSINKALEKKFGAKVFVAGDAACAAFAEKRLNPDADTDNLLYIYSSVGRGMVLKKDRWIGEEDDGEMSESSRYLRPWSDGLSIAGIARDEVSRGIGTGIVELAKGKLENITEEAVVKAARQGDDVAAAIMETAALKIGLRIAYLVNLFAPEVVVIGGGPEKAWDLVAAPINKTVKKFVFVKLTDIVKIIPGVLGEDAAGLGAVSLAAERDQIT